MSSRVFLLRHGRTSWNAERRFQGQADPPLDDVGRAQAYEVATLVAALAPNVLVSSDAMRAVQTAEPIAEITGLEVLVDARLRERSLGHWEGLTRDEVAQRWPRSTTCQTSKRLWSLPTARRRWPCALPCSACARRYTSSAPWPTATGPNSGSNTTTVPGRCGACAPTTSGLPVPSRRCRCGSRWPTTTHPTPTHNGRTAFAERAGRCGARLWL
jgi:hypothetical protein